MMLLPLGMLALVSLLAQSATAMLGELPEGYVPGHIARTTAGARYIAEKSVSYVPDRHTSHGLGRRRSIWQVLFGEKKDGMRRRAVPSSRILSRRPSTRISPRKRSCKARSSNSTTSSSASSSSSSPSTPTGAPEDSKTGTNKIMAGYWADWTSSTFPVTSIDYTKFDNLNYAFAIPTSNLDLSIPTDPSGNLLRRFVKACKAGNTKALLSIGGWGGSTYFSLAVRTASARATLIGNIIKYYNTYSLDGIDLDWEYPGQVGAGNHLDPSDTANFQTFLTQLRAALPQGALITGAVSHTPWRASSGHPVASVARAAAAMDYIMIMNYDVWGSSANPGPNAPLANLCGNSTQPQASAAAGVKAWSAAGMPRNKILLGIPAYGYINTSSKKTLKQKRAVQLTSMDASTSSGQISFSTLVNQGALKLGAEALYHGSGGWVKYWDDCSDTPFLSDGNKVVTYDDTSSIYDKGAFVGKARIGGVSMWSLDGDTKDWALTNSVIAGMSSS
ncbi:hypothetical protein NDA14_002119 [Ustilago hordei]|nr:hypothetical protein NDA14_000403 [Ustilago hordei]KAJ1603817.1 hypothetical protein NDA14_002119 [Ustilago hordei]